MATMAKGDKPPRSAAARFARFVHDWLPVTVVLFAVLVAWYVAAWALNAPGAIERVLDADGVYRFHLTITPSADVEALSETYHA